LIIGNAILQAVPLHEQLPQFGDHLPVPFPPFALLPAQAVREALVDSLPLIPRQSDNLNLFSVIRHTNLSLTPLRPKTFPNEKGIQRKSKEK
jgi:hypothetical protein